MKKKLLFEYIYICGKGKTIFLTFTFLKFKNPLSSQFPLLLKSITTFIHFAGSKANKITYTLHMYSYIHKLQMKSKHEKRIEHVVSGNY